jgi:putative transposase
VYSPVLPEVVLRGERAFHAFFQRSREGQTPGYPRCHGRDRDNRLTAPPFGQGAPRDTGCRVRSTSGRRALRWRRPLEGTPKTVTIRREAEGWYAGIACAHVLTQPVPRAGQETGMALGRAACAPLAAGSQVANPRSFRVAHLKLKRAPRRVSRRQKGSQRRRNAARLLAKAPLKGKRQRQDFHHTSARALLRLYDTSEHDDVPTANLRTHHPLAKSMADAGWSTCLSIRTYQAACAGQRVVAVPPAYPAHACSGCGVLGKKGVSVRWHTCPECGTSRHRDHHAARNILQRGQASRAGQALQALTQPAGAYVA